MRGRVCTSMLAHLINLLVLTYFNYVSSWSFQIRQTLKSLTKESSEEAWFVACDVIFDAMLSDESHLDFGDNLMLTGTAGRERRWKKMRASQTSRPWGQPQSDLTQHQWYRGRSALRQMELPAPMEVVRNGLSVLKVDKGKGKEVVTGGKKRLARCPSVILTESENESESSQSNHPPSWAPFNPKSSRPVAHILKCAQVAFIFQRKEDDNNVESPPMAGSTSSCATCRAKCVECQRTLGDACTLCRKCKVKCSLATKDRRVKGQKSKASIADVDVGVNLAAWPSTSKDQAPPPANADETALLHQKSWRLLRRHSQEWEKTVPPPPPPAAASSTVMDNATATIKKHLKMLELTVESLIFKLVMADGEDDIGSVQLDAMFGTGIRSGEEKDLRFWGPAHTPP
ncbi:hypothetical protein PAXRUDRAFT_27735 [Paxillus rubicundulus Ve08.2h10]|uniref:Unplaced genomic scaffold scaffold_885, whole genome shotgun sequence n=1 Tax=Paxillus rubicundulus Ve08.2h10 TaxID=930991 RepID=A0A0D0DJV2_9AGAM|nr:hypothetical protein PAXRUDRAFT_27735 [Paxillus rubicundulus Ve08.2h10]